jgi:hypothetical protein
MSFSANVDSQKSILFTGVDGKVRVFKSAVVR